MATINSRKGKKGVTHTVQIRMVGHEPVTKTFKRLTDAREWAASTENEIRNGKFVDVRKIQDTLGEILDKYMKRISVKKKPNTYRREKTCANALYEGLGEKSGISGLIFCLAVHDPIPTF